MDSLNSTSSRSATPAQNMRNLEKAINMADQRLVMRRAGTGYAQAALCMMFGLPFCSYMIYNFFAPSGVMHNYKASSGAYMSWLMKWLLTIRTTTATYRPEIDNARQMSPLNSYTKKIESARAEGAPLTEGVHHPTSWL